jgi:hypothetical protein
MAHANLTDTHVGVSVCRTVGRSGYIRELQVRKYVRLADLLNDIFLDFLQSQ